MWGKSLRSPMTRGETVWVESPLCNPLFNVHHMKSVIHQTSKTALLDLESRIIKAKRVNINLEIILPN